MNVGARCIERLLLGRSTCVSLCAALKKPAIPSVAIQLLEASCVAAPLSFPVWQQLFDWGHLNMHGTRIWASVWETIPSVAKPYNLETAPPSLWLLFVTASTLSFEFVLELTSHQVCSVSCAHQHQARYFSSGASVTTAQLANMPGSLERAWSTDFAAQGSAELRRCFLQGC